MYGKIFSSTFSGSMFGAGPDVFAVWAYVIANAQDSRVELSPRVLAATIGTTPDRVEEAIEYLCRPDPESRNPEHDGRRLVKEGQYQYLVVSHSIYRSLQDEEARREYNAARQRVCRAKKRVTQSSHTLSHTVTTNNNASVSASASALEEGTRISNRGFQVPEPRGEA